MLLTALALEGCVTDQVQHAIARRRQTAQHILADRLKQGMLRPPPASSHAPQRPILQARRHNPAHTFKRPFVWHEDQADEQPAKEYKVVRLRAAEVRLEAIEEIVYFWRQTRQAKHVSPLC